MKRDWDEEAKDSVIYVRMKYFVPVRQFNITWKKQYDTGICIGKVSTKLYSFFLDCFLLRKEIDWMKLRFLTLIIISIIICLVNSCFRGVASYLRIPLPKYFGCVLMSALLWMFFQYIERYCQPFISFVCLNFVCLNFV